MYHPDEDRTDVFELYDQPAEALAEAQDESMVHRHARTLCEEGFPQARFRQVYDHQRTVWADDQKTMEIECREESKV